MNLTQYPAAKDRLSDASNQLEARAMIGTGGVSGFAGQQSGPELYPAARLNLPNPIPLTMAGRLALSLDYMMAHLNRPIRISTVSAIAGCSESRYYELFKNVTGDSPLNWFNRARMRWAGELLESTSGSIKQIASQVGYEDPFYFSRLFKSVHGIAPSEYRVRKEQAQVGGAQRKRHQDASGHAKAILGANGDGSEHATCPGR